jgi:hypothetical protein
VSSSCSFQSSRSLPVKRTAGRWRSGNQSTGVSTISPKIVSLAARTVLTTPSTRAAQAASSVTAGHAAMRVSFSGVPVRCAPSASGLIAMIRSISRSMRVAVVSSQRHA